MKLLAILALLVILVVAICPFMPSESRVDSRAWLTISKVSLKGADADLHKFGIFTNRFKNVRVDSYTNRYAVDGVDYQCEKSLSDDEVQEIALRLLRFFGILVRPLPGETEA
jgi:hypothetical protein